MFSGGVSHAVMLSLHSRLFVALQSIAQSLARMLRDCFGSACDSERLQLRMEKKHPGQRPATDVRKLDSSSYYYSTSESDPEEVYDSDAEQAHGC